MVVVSSSETLVLPVSLRVSVGEALGEGVSASGTVSTASAVDVGPSDTAVDIGASSDSWPEVDCCTVAVAVEVSADVGSTVEVDGSTDVVSSTEVGSSINVGSSLIVEFSLDVSGSIADSCVVVVILVGSGFIVENGRVVMISSTSSVVESVLLDTHAPSRLQKLCFVSATLRPERLKICLLTDSSSWASLLCFLRPAGGGLASGPIKYAFSSPPSANPFKLSSCPLPEAGRLFPLYYFLEACISKTRGAESIFDRVSCVVQQLRFRCEMGFLESPKRTNGFFKYDG